MTVTKVVKSEGIPWQPRGRTGSLQPMRQFCKLDGLLPSATPSPSSSLLPPLPCHTTAVQQGLPGLKRHPALNDIVAIFLHAIMSLLSPAITTQYIRNTAKAITEFTHCICCRFEIPSKIKCQLSFIYTREKCHLEVVLHSPLTTNGKSKCQPMSDFSHGLTLVPKLS